jgi:hypothetical protein
MSAPTIILFVIAITISVFVIAVLVGYAAEVLAIRKERKDARRRNQAHKVK